MDNKAIRVAGDDTPVLGGGALPVHLIADNLGGELAPSDDLGRQIFWLLKLNANKLSLKYDPAELSGMDDAAKRARILKIQQLLGIEPFKSNTL